MNVLENFVGTPWPYQEEDIRNVCDHKGRMILGHKTGLGKTFISLAAISKFAGSDVKRVLIVGTKSALAVWMREVPRWNEREVEYIGKDTKNRDATWNSVCYGGQGVWLINHSLFRQYVRTYWEQCKILGKKAKKWHWDVVVVDEAHKLKNRKSQLFESVSRIESNALLLLTATPASRGAQDMWSYLHLLNPRMFSSYWKFVNTFCYVDREGYGSEVFGTRNVPALKELLKDYYVTRTYSEVLPQLPPLRRQLVGVDMEGKQLAMYKEFEEEMILQLPSGDLLVAPGVLAQMTRLRQIALCPRALDVLAPLGIGVETILEDLEDSGESHIVIFSLYSKILHVLGEELHKRGYDVEYMEGGLEPTEINERVNRFKTNRGIMLCVIACAQSFALDTVSVAYVLGAEFDPSANIQAEGRLRRADSQLPSGGVLIKYIIPLGSREVVTKEILNGKVMTVQQFLGDYGK